MIEDSILNYVILFMLLEIYEVYWQKAHTIMGMLARMYQHYSKNILVFLLMQPTFYFAVGFAMVTNYNGFALAFLALKTMDILTKMLLIKQVFIKKELSKEFTELLLQPIKEYYFFIGLVLYSGLIFLALS